MKKILILLLFVCSVSYSQIPIRNSIMMVYGGDTLKFYFDTDTMNYESNLAFHKFKDGAVIMDSININGIWYTSISSQAEILVSDGITKKTGDTIVLGGDIYDPVLITDHNTGETDHFKIIDDYGNFLSTGSMGVWILNANLGLNFTINNEYPAFMIFGSSGYSRILTINGVQRFGKTNSTYFPSGSYGGVYVNENDNDLYYIYNNDSTNITDPVKFDHLEQDTSNIRVVLDSDDSLKYAINVYAGMYLDSNIVATDIVTQNVWEHVGNFTISSVFENATYTEDTIWIDYDGIYRIDFSASAYNIITAENYEIGISINGNDPLKEARKIQYFNPANKYQMTINYNSRLNAGDYLTVKVRDIDATRDIVFIYGTFSITKLN